MTNKIMKITNIGVWTVYLLWTLYMLFCYWYAWFSDPHAELTMGTGATYVNWSINLIFMINLAANAVLVRMDKAKAREK